MKLRFFFLYFFIAGYCHFSFAVIYSLPTNNDRLIGRNKVVLIPKNNTKSLEYFAAKYHLGLSNILEANPGIDPYLPKGNTLLRIPHQLILPDTIHEGIIINSAEMRLFYYKKDSNIVIVLPIAIGQLGNDTPDNRVMKIKNKKANPTWTPTSKIREEYRSIGKKLPKVVPEGPDNPMGLYALYIGDLYAIHGTNVNFGIGLRVSHGCVRLRNDDIKFLFENVPIGTRVQFINEPIKATIESDGNYYLEVHHPLSTKRSQIHNNETVPLNLKSKIINFIKKPNVNSSIVSQAFKNRTGIPIRVNQ